LVVEWIQRLVALVVELEHRIFAGAKIQTKGQSPLAIASRIGVKVDPPVAKNSGKNGVGQRRNPTASEMGIGLQVDPRLAPLQQGGFQRHVD
jgi:hypothetical protein